MKTLIVYDLDGKIFYEVTGTVTAPNGLPHQIVEVPENKTIDYVDVNGAEHVVVFKDIPLSEVEQLRVETAQSNAEIFEMMLMMSGGGA